MTDKAPKTFVFYIVPDFTMLAFTSAIEALRLANAVRGEELYRWRIVSSNGEPVRASCGMLITPDGSVADEKAKTRDEQPNVVAVCAGWHVEKSTNKSVAAWLRWSRNAGASIAGICTGPYLLAEAGLLAEKRCTIHWENLPSFSERFPDLVVSSNLIEYDGRIFTCAGGTASFDLMLHMIESDLGRKTALAVCDQAIVDRVRSPSEKQRRLVRTLEKLHPVLLDAVEYMESNMADHVSMDEVARHIRLSRRQLERMFAAELGSSPSRFFLELRLDHARLMVLQSGTAIVDVAVACGFVSASHFTRCFRMQYGVSPQRMREEAPRSAHLPSLSAPTAVRIGNWPPRVPSSDMFEDVAG